MLVLQIIEGLEDGLFVRRTGDWHLAFWREEPERTSAIRSVLRGILRTSLSPNPRAPAFYRTRSGGRALLGCTRRSYFLFDSDSRV